MAPVTVAVVDDAIVMSTRETAYKVGHLRRRPDTSLCVFPDKWLGRWVQLNCRAEITSLPDAMDTLIAFYRALSGEHPDWDEYREAMQRQQKCLISIDVTGWGPVATGGFPSSKKAMFEKWQPGGEFAEQADQSPQMFDD